MIAMPRLWQVPSPNYSNRPTPEISLVVVHDCQGSGRGAAGWFAQLAARVSAHLVLDENGADVYQCVPLNCKAWHACNANPYSIGVEMGGFAEKGFAEAELAADALVVAWLLHAYALPCRFVVGAERGGWTTHYRLGEYGGGHTDFTTDPAVEKAYAARVQAAYEALALGPLPSFALHGLPAPHATVLPPQPPAGFQPHALSLRDNSDNGWHASGSGYPCGSVADVQWRLNRAGNTPKLEVDGLIGPATRQAIFGFQVKAGLAADGLVGPKTWAALARAS